MRTFDGLHVEIKDAIVIADGSVAGIGQRAGLAIAETSNIVLVSAEVLSFIGLELERAELMRNHIPNNLVGSHIFRYSL